MTNRSLMQHAEALRRREYSSLELTQAYLEKIERDDCAIGAYLTVTAEKALIAAKQADARFLRGEERSILDGIPFALKDNICTKGVRTTCASRMLAEYVPPYAATVAERLEKAGGILLGKTNMDEFSMGSTTEYSALGSTKNPRDPRRVPGGSSGGSAAAVAAGEAVYALGSDTGGSIRQPAAFCGVVGMKPTYGSVSRYGLIAFASSLEQIGPLTRTVADNAAVLSVLAGRDGKDATMRERRSVDFSSKLTVGARGLRIGLPKELMGREIAEEVRTAVLAAADVYRDMGAEIRWISLPSLKQALAAYYVVSSAEASSNLARFDGVRYGYRASGCSTADELCRRSRTEGLGVEVKRRILWGTMVLSEGYYDEYYKKAMRCRQAISAELLRVWEKCDLLISPAAPTVAFELGRIKENSLEQYEGDLCGVAANLSGIPALCLPCGKGEGEMPVGLQLMGARDSETTLYRAGYALEQAIS